MGPEYQPTLVKKRIFINLRLVIMLKSITSFINNDHKSKLQGIVDLLRDKQLFSLASGPYPVNHGEKACQQSHGTGWEIYRGDRYGSIAG